MLYVKVFESNKFHANVIARTHANRLNLFRTL